MNLKNIWSALMVSLGAEENLSLCDEVLARYEESHRHYHTREHLRACVRYWRELASSLSEPSAVLLALFYHDAVYDVHRFDNEEASAELFRRHAAVMGLASFLVDKVATMILATKTHVAHDADTQALLDIDLSILGEAPHVFDQFECDIRAEYAWVPEAIFREKRTQILRGFLDRPWIYHTPALRTRLESQARHNLSRRIAQLEAS